MSASEDWHVHPRCLRKSMQGACKMLVVLTSHPPPHPSARLPTHTHQRKQVYTLDHRTSSALASNCLRKEESASVDLHPYMFLEG